MENEIKILIGRERAEEKQRSRDEDARRLAAGEVTAAELQAENSFFGCLDLSSFRIAAIGGKAIKPDDERR